MLMVQDTGTCRYHMKNLRYRTFGASIFPTAKKYIFNLISVADPGCLSRKLNILNLGSRVQQQNQNNFLCPQIL
jgi:hypothetical protein